MIPPSQRASSELPQTVALGLGGPCLIPALVAVGWAVVRGAWGWGPLRLCVGPVGLEAGVGVAHALSHVRRYCSSLKSLKILRHLTPSWCQDVSADTGLEDAMHSVTRAFR